MIYDNYYDHMTTLPKVAVWLERQRNERIADWILNNACVKINSVLEIGPGAGLFAEVCKQRGWDYTCVERNAKIADALTRRYNTISAEIPPMPDALKGRKFDLVYAAYVVEHLADGLMVFDFVQQLQSLLAPGGQLVLVVPDSLSLGLELWNQDYTHRYPTSWRNMTYALRDAKYNNIQLIKYRGSGWIGWRRLLLKVVSAFYSYPVLMSIFRGKAWPYSLYQYIAMEALVFMARKN